MEESLPERLLLADVAPIPPPPTPKGMAQEETTRVWERHAGKRRPEATRPVETKQPASMAEGDEKGHRMRKTASKRPRTRGRRFLPPSAFSRPMRLSLVGERRRRLRRRCRQRLGRRGAGPFPLVVVARSVVPSPPSTESPWIPSIAAIRLRPLLAAPLPTKQKGGPWQATCHSLPLVHRPTTARPYSTEERREKRETKNDERSSAASHGCPSPSCRRFPSVAKAVVSVKDST